MIDLLPGHSGYSAQVEAQKKLAAEKELEKSFLMANKAKRKRLYNQYDYIKAKFADPRDRSIYLGYKHKRPKAREDVQELVYYRKNKVYYSRTMRKYMGLKNVWSIVSADSRPIVVTDYDSQTDCTAEFYARLVRPKVEASLMQMSVEALQALMLAEKIVIK